MLDTVFGITRQAWRVRIIAVALISTLLLALFGTATANAGRLALPKVRDDKPVPVKEVDRRPLKRVDQTAEHAWKPPRGTAFPKAGTAKGAVPAAGKAVKVSAGSLPVWVQGTGARTQAGGAVPGPTDVQVQVLDQDVTRKLGISGVVLAVRGLGGSEGDVALGIDYQGFRHMYGGDWASRLTLRRLPACMLTTPGATGCGTSAAVRTANDPKNGSLSASVRLAPQDPRAAGERAPVEAQAGAKPTATSTGLAAEPGTVLLAVTAAPSGSAGDFKASSLSPSGRWTAGGSSGGFGWSYEFDLPEVPGDLDPDLALAYSSQSVDGRTASTNNQANWIGEGWSMNPGAISRRYVACDDDKTGGNNPSTKVGDQCWKTDNATMTLNGESHELVRDDATKTWRLKDDDGTRVEKLTDVARGNGDNDGEYWRVTTPDGTRYHFGYNRLPGWASGRKETNSTWTAPVFGNQSGEPCHAAAFASSWCQQAWQWNLDYVEDPHGNAMAYYWEKELGRYALNVNASTGKGTDTEYVRGGYLDHVDYGLRSDGVYAANGAAARVDFGVSERCLSDCGTFDKSHASNWPDVPFDQHCTTAAACTSPSPTFWTRKRLTSVTSKALVGSTYKTADSWALAHEFPSPGDGTDPALWLASITRTGHSAATPITLPPVTFKGQQLANRVAAAITDPVPPLVRYRVYGIETESGGTVAVTYSPQDCTAADLPSPSANTRRCYPVNWSPPDAPATGYEPYKDWFHAYVVTEVLESDNVGGSPVKTTSYTYLDNPAWTKDDDEFTKDKYRTYSERRGYGRVQERVGGGSDTKTLTEYRYFRGIDGAQVADSEGNAVTDRESFAGMTREEARYDRDGGRIVDAVSSTPWRSAATATHTRAGLPDQVAYMTGTGSEATRELKADGGWLRTAAENAYNSQGQITSVSETGDMAKSGDERCTTTSYAHNDAANMLDYESEVRVVAEDCASSPDLPKDLVSADRTYYDGSTVLGAAPTKGDATREDEEDGDGTGYITTATTTYDQYGRELTSTDGAGAKTGTSYAPAAGAAPTKITTTNALGHTDTSEEDPLRGAPIAETDENGRRADAELDALGRVVRRWEPGWSKSDHPDQPTAEYAYSITKTAAPYVATKTIQHDGSYRTSYTIYDGLLRERQTQEPAIGGGRIVNEKLYDTREFAWKTYNDYYASGEASGTLVTASDAAVPNMTENVHDGLGQVTAAISRKYGTETKRTTTTYSSDQVTVTPPQGGVKQTTVTDARDHVVELLQYTDPASGTTQKTTYGYDKHDQLAKMTDPAGNVWTNAYDARGRMVSSNDPDKGTTTTAYDNADRPVTTTDARGVTLTTTYDALGRKTEVKQGSTVRASWTYDTVLKGELTSSTRIADGEKYITAIGGYNDRDQPTSTTVTIPGGNGTTQAYTYSYGYNTYTGQQEWTLYPSLGQLPSERVTTVFGEGGLPQKTTAGQTVLVGATSYDAYGRPRRTEYGPSGSKAYKTQYYDEHTGDMTRQVTDRDTAPQRIDDTTYTRDDAGNITSIATIAGQDAAQTVDRQCFTTDGLRRLTEAWTTTAAACQRTPSPSAVAGPEPYWLSYAYDAVGNRTKETRHQVPGTTTGDIVRTYTHPAAGDPRPHATTAVATAGGPENGTTDAFAYDAAGNMNGRKEGGRSQGLTWDAEGRLASVTEDGKTTGYVYDGDGNRLLSRGPDGSTTLYLPGDDELTTRSDGGRTAVRYYAHGPDDDEAVAVRTSAGLYYTFADHQGTALTAVRAGEGQDVARRRQLPYGEDRTAQAAFWPDSHGFVDGVDDPTGLTHLGAREYDPRLGSFISVDPVIDPDDPAQQNAYTYGNDSPVTYSDPDGMRPLGPTDRGYLSGGDSAYDRKHRQKSHWKYSRKKGWGYSVRKVVHRHGQYRISRTTTQWSKARKTTYYHSYWVKKKPHQAKKHHKSIWGKAWGKTKKVAKSAGKGIAKGATAAWKFTMKHRGQIATGAALGVCLGAGWVACGIATGVAYGVRAQKRWHDDGFRDSWRANVHDGVFTAVSFGNTSAMEYAKFGQFSKWIRPSEVQARAPFILRRDAWRSNGPRANGVGAYHGIYTLALSVPAIVGLFRHY